MTQRELANIPNMKKERQKHRGFADVRDVAAGVPTAGLPGSDQLPGTQMEIHLNSETYYE